MKRVIYSLYVDVPAKEHFGDSKNKHDTVDKANVTINAFKKQLPDRAEVLIEDEIPDERGTRFTLIGKI